MSDPNIPHCVSLSDDCRQTLERLLFPEEEKKLSFLSDRAALVSFRETPEVFFFSASLGSVRVLEAEDGTWRDIGAVPQNQPLKIHFGNGSTFHDFIQDMRSLSRNDRSPLMIGKTMDKFFGKNLSRRSLEEILNNSDTEDLNLWKKTVESVVVDPKKLPDISEEDIVEFTKKFGRPPFPFLLINEQRTYEEIASKTPITIPLFQKHVPFLKHIRQSEFSYVVNEIKPWDPFSATVRFVGKNVNETLNFSPKDPQEHEKFLRSLSEGTIELGRSAQEYAKSYYMRVNSAESVLETAKICSSRGISFSSFALVECLATLGDRPLSVPEKRLVVDVLQHCSSLKLSRENVVAGGKAHELLVANITRGRAGSTLPGRGAFVLLCDGEFPLGRYVLGGVSALRKQKIELFLQQSRAKTPDKGFER